MKAKTAARRAASKVVHYRGGLLDPRRRQCNVCGKRGRFSDITADLDSTLAAHGSRYRVADFETLNARYYQCLECGASDRDRLYLLWFERFLSRGPRRRVLEFAPSRPLEARLRERPDVDYRSADLFMPDVDDVVDITDMKGYPDGAFEVFICSHVLEHVDSDAAAISELHRILAPGGRGIAMVPIAPDGAFDEDVSETDVSERWRRFGQDDHVRLYDRTTFVRNLAAGGFVVEQLGWRAFGLQRMLRHALAPRSVLYVVTKPATT
ncbi:class I SAM-dependent methyltransferase [Nocardioides kongjuensis]|uniref:SAM-dependent methyltransferase n=1 Tax=Nocardioides kongjuensis TaxID=349522 RepID=A0A852RFY4_9ACTN|nr:methyltransferase domain-containing protein [Nocardioides kongjuensis]NYD32217.1 SAM-dependent methyltransferase [Nocardioides kongjuensis]